MPYVTGLFESHQDEEPALLPPSQVNVRKGLGATSGGLVASALCVKSLSPPINPSAGREWSLSHCGILSPKTAADNYSPPCMHTLHQDVDGVSFPSP